MKHKLFFIRTPASFITERTVVGKDEIDITRYYLPLCQDMAKRWRKGEDSNLR